MTRRTLALAALVALFTLPAFAQEEESAEDLGEVYIEDGQRFRRPKTQKMDFEIMDVDAPALRPGVAMVPERVRGCFDPLIELRADFDDAMEASVDEVR